MGQLSVEVVMSWKPRVHCRPWKLLILLDITLGRKVIPRCRRGPVSSMRLLRSALKRILGYLANPQEGDKLTPHLSLKNLHPGKHLLNA